MPTPRIALLDMYVAASGAPLYLPWMPGADVHVVPVSSGAQPGPAHTYDGVVLTGSKASLVDGVPWAEPVVGWLQDALQRDVPVLGCCFGHQLLAEAAFGSGSVFKTPVPEVGYLHIDVSVRDALMSALPERFRAFVSHEDAVAPRTGMQILARSAQCPVQSFRVSGRRAWGVQFHVEYDRAEEERILRYREHKHGAQLPSADAMLRHAVDSDPLAERLFARFLDLVRAGPPTPR